MTKREKLGLAGLALGIAATFVWIGLMGFALSQAISCASAKKPSRHGSADRAKLANRCPPIQADCMAGVNNARSPHRVMSIRGGNSINALQVLSLRGAARAAL